MITGVSISYHISQIAIVSLILKMQIKKNNNQQLKVPSYLQFHSNTTPTTFTYH